MLWRLISAVIVACAAYVIIYIFKNPTDSTNNNETYTYSSHHNHQTIDLNKLSSSVFCRYDRTSNKICMFKDICYVPDSSSFLFILRNESVISGLSSKDDLKIISLSSVKEHNNLFLKLQTIIGYDSFFKDSPILVNEPIFLVSRFKSDNIMHVIHDDILPLFMTYDYLCNGNIVQCVKDNRLMFADDSKYSSYIEWYNIFSNKKPYSLNNLKMLTCFDKIFVGLSSETLWFQYGFGTPQGPLLHSNINSLVINRFKNIVLNSFKVSELTSDFLNVVFLSRKLNRRILNEQFVVHEILGVCKEMFPKYNHRIKVHVLDLSQNKSVDIISVVVKSKILIGMHGSAMILSLFLPNNAAVVELFPFGIQPQHVSPTRALSQLPGTLLSYLSWRNFKEVNSVAHPEWSPLLGGIYQFSKDEQDKIMKIKQVPAVECCHDPVYLYRMFQDTKVDESFRVILKQALMNQKEVINTNENSLDGHLKDTWFYPGFVSNLNCKIDQSAGVVYITWSKPYNLQIMKSEPSVSYYVTVKIISRVVTLETFLYTVSIKLSMTELEDTLVKSNGIEIWIRALTDNVEGSETYGHC